MDAYILINQELQMSKNKKFKHESQDARRHDQQHVVHPEVKTDHSPKKSIQKKNTKIEK